MMENQIASNDPEREVLDRRARPHTVIVRSELYGREDFPYDSYDEAVAAVGRLLNAAERLQDNEGRTYEIQRTELLDKDEDNEEVD